MSSVFISYSRRDIEHARKLVTFLRSSGLEVWWDEQIPAGADWSERLRGELDRASVVVALWSANSVDATRRLTSEFLELEHRRAAHKLLPLRVEAVTPPLEFAHLHAPLWTPGDDAAEAALLGAIRAAIARPMERSTARWPIAHPHLYLSDAGVEWTILHSVQRQLTRRGWWIDGPDYSWANIDDPSFYDRFDGAIRLCSAGMPDERAIEEGFLLKRRLRVVVDADHCTHIGNEALADLLYLQDWRVHEAQCARELHRALTRFVARECEFSVLASDLPDVQVVHLAAARHATFGDRGCVVGKLALPGVEGYLRRDGFSVHGVGNELDPRAARMTIFIGGDNAAPDWAPIVRDRLRKGSGMLFANRPLTDWGLSESDLLQRFDGPAFQTRGVEWGKLVGILRIQLNSADQVAALE